MNLLELLLKTNQDLFSSINKFVISTSRFLKSLTDLNICNVFMGVENVVQMLYK